MKLTSTNNSIDLIISRLLESLASIICSIKQILFYSAAIERNQKLDKTYSNIALSSLYWRSGPFQKAGLYGLVIIAKVDPHVPIPNTTVKPFSADGTAS